MLDTYTGAINAIVNSLKLIDGKIHHFLHTHWVANIHFDSKCSIFRICSMSFAVFCTF